MPPHLLKICSLFPCLLFAFILRGQATFELGGFVGFTQYQGDLAENNIQLEETLLAKGLLGRLRLNDFFALRMSYINGDISGDDKNASEPAQRMRGWHFDARVNEFALLGEGYFPGAGRVSRRTFRPSVMPFVFAGVALTHADARVVVPENDPASFPEPGDKDSFFAIPIGVGARVYVSERATLGAEVGWRALFSDHLDDVSQNGRPDKNDWYAFAGLTLSIRIGALAND
ncbi:MAG: hypothetical protein D6714_09320 [Bacteroidetes bacterium]|nr:MAG: hypothetical protein D6714_09320 [Bacteroidota bacterium]